MSTENFDMTKLVQEIKQKGGFLTAKDIENIPQNPSQIKDFVEHMRSCNNDGCEIHNAMDEKEKGSMMRGFALGNKFGNKYPGVNLDE